MYSGFDRDLDPADLAFFEDGEWITWSEINQQLQHKEWQAKYPNANQYLIPYFETLISAAENYYADTGRHLNVYGDIGELYGAITLGLELHSNYAQGSDGKLGNDFVEVKTITPFNGKDTVAVKRRGNFNKLLIVRINEGHAISSRLIDRKNLPKGKGKYIRLSWKDISEDANIPDPDC